MERNKAVELRKQGFSYKEILEKIDVSKGSLSLWLKDIKLDSKSTERLKEKAKQANLEKDKKITKEDRKKWANKSVLTINEKLKDPVYNEKYRRSHSMRDAWYASGLTYRQDEMPVKTQLEKITGRIFRKEKIGDSFCDFVDNLYIIEHTLDLSRGISEAIDRLNNVHTDKTKIIVTDTEKLGIKRLKRCKDLYFIDVKKFWAGEFTLITPIQIIGSLCGLSKQMRYLHRKEEILNLNKKGISINSIGKELKIPASTVGRMIKRVLSNMSNTDMRTK